MILIILKIKLICYVSVMGNNFIGEPIWKEEINVADMMRNVVMQE